MADVTSSAVANFSDARCTAGGVSPDDPLVFTCEISNAVYLRIDLPACYQDYISIGDTVDRLDVPAGFTAESLVITEIDDTTRNFSLTLSIANASLLNGGQITCCETSQNMVMAGCPLAGKPSV